MSLVQNKLFHKVFKKEWQKMQSDLQKVLRTLNTKVPEDSS